MKDFLKRIKLNEGNISLGLGIVVMVVAGILLINYFRNINTIGTRESRIMSAATEIVPTPSDSPMPAVSGRPTAIPSPTSKISPKAATPTKVLAVASNTPIASPIPTKALSRTPTKGVQASPAPAQMPSSAQTINEREYVVKSGDSLWKIAQSTYGSGYEWTKIYDANKTVIGRNPSKIAVGAKLQLPTISVALPQSPVEYTVKAGDNLWNISTQICGSGSVYTAIAAANSIPNPRLVRPGLKLSISCPRMR